MSSALKNVIVVGGSGNVGREILAALLASKEDFGTIATLKRKDAPMSEIVKGFQARGVKVVEADYKDKASLVEAFTGTLPPRRGEMGWLTNLGADVVISTVNVPAFNDQYLFLEAAIEAKSVFNWIFLISGSSGLFLRNSGVTPISPMSPTSPTSNQKSN